MTDLKAQGFSTDEILSLKQEAEEHLTKVRCHILIAH